MPSPKAPKPRKPADHHRRLFVQEYLVDQNATQAAIRAGYSKRSARQQGARLMADAAISAEIEAALKRREKRTEITADLVLQELLRLARVDLAQAFDAAGYLLPIAEMPEDVRRAIAGIETEYRPGGIIVKKVKFWDKKGALELLGRHLSLFVDRQHVEHSGSVKVVRMPARAADSKAWEGSTKA